MIRRRAARSGRADGAGAPRRRLFAKYLLICASLVGAALLVSGLLQIWFTYQQTSASQGRVEREEAATAAATLGQFVGQIQPQLQLVNQTVLAASPSQAGTSDERRSQYEILITQAPPITSLLYVDVEGRERLAVTRLAASVVDSGADFSQDPTFLEARRTGTIANSAVAFHGASEPYAILAVPERGAGTGVLLAELNLKFVGDVVSQLTTGQAGYAYVVDDQGKLIAHHDVNLVLQNHDLSGLPQVKAALAAARSGARETLLGGGQGEAAVIGRDLQGRQVLSAHQRIALNGWLVFVDQPLTAAYAPVYSSIIRTAALLVAGLALAVLASFVLARRMVAPIRSLQAGAARIGSGDLEQRIDLHTGDELEALGEAFNQMTGRLRESYATLERKVEDRTRDLAEALDQQTVTADVLRVISRSPVELQSVLETLGERAARLCEAAAANIFRIEGETIRSIAGYGTQPSLPQGRRLSHEYIADRAALERQTLHIVGECTELEDEFPGSMAAVQALTGWDRAAWLAVPLLRQTEPIGVFVLRRPDARPYTDKQITLVETFADQAVIAIENARLFEELQEKSDQLAIADRAKSEFLSRMSHELRTPLNAIIGFAEIMEMDPQTPATQQEWIQHVLKAGRHLLGLINEVLDIARIEAGRLSLSLEPVAVDAAVDEVLDLVRPLAARDEIQVEASASGGPAGAGAWVRADRQRLQQVLLNLLTNAIKYNHAGGSVTMSAGESAGGRLRLTVRDTGSGIPADRLGRLFTPFDRLGAEETGIEGNGLGLAISRRLIEAMDGAIGVESIEGEGSAFWIELPPAAAPATPPAAAGPAVLLPSTNGGPRRAATVLYIEDNLSNLELMKALLAFRPGITLLSAIQGTLGLTLAQEHHPDLILLDLNLPDMHGEEVLRRLRQDERTRPVPVAVISADATPAQQQRALAGGASAYLTKPLNVKQLLDLLEEVLVREGTAL